MSNRIEEWYKLFSCGSIDCVSIVKQMAYCYFNNSRFSHRNKRFLNLVGRGGGINFALTFECTDFGMTMQNITKIFKLATFISCVYLEAVYTHSCFFH